MPPCSTPRHALILAGGSGTRLWPLSRTLLPKQLLTLDGNQTLLQGTAERVAEFFAQERIYVVTNEEHVFEVRSQLKQMLPGLEHQTLAEPFARNTLPAILLGLAAVVESDPRAVVGVFPADHLVTDRLAWREGLDAAALLAENGWFVTFGVTPDTPETGYGYIHRGEELSPVAFAVKGFMEKPDATTAEQFLESGEYFWNSGMFVFRADVFLDAVKTHAPQLYEWFASREARPLVEGYAALPNLSVDYGLVEKIDRIAMVRASFDWDDLGSWEALYRLGAKDERGCVIKGDAWMQGGRRGEG